MGAWLATAWGQVWPNLVADALWVPVVGIHHVMTRRHLRELREHIEKKVPDHPKEPS